MIIGTAFFVVFIIEMIVIHRHFIKGPDALFRVVIEFLTEHDVIQTGALTFEYMGIVDIPHGSLFLNGLRRIQRVITTTR